MILIDDDGSSLGSLSLSASGNGESYMLKSALRQKSTTRSKDMTASRQKTPKDANVVVTEPKITSITGTMQAEELQPMA